MKESQQYLSGIIQRKVRVYKPRRVSQKSHTCLPFGNWRIFLLLCMNDIILCWYRKAKRAIHTKEGLAKQIIFGTTKGDLKFEKPALKQYRDFILAFFEIIIIGLLDLLVVSNWPTQYVGGLFTVNTLDHQAVIVVRYRIKVSSDALSPERIHLTVLGLVTFGYFFPFIAKSFNDSFTCGEDGGGGEGVRERWGVGDCSCEGWHCLRFRAAALAEAVSGEQQCRAPICLHNSTCKHSVLSSSVWL